LTDPITDYVLCDNDGDGVELFDLRSKDIEILNTLVNVTLGYFETQADAQANVNQIINDTSYPNVSDPQTIWVRGENILGCVTVSSFLLLLDEVPIYVDPTPFEVCDDEVADGITEFDLNSKNGEISDGDISLSITYYGTQGDAQAAVNPLPIPYTNTVNPEVIWVRIESNITGCYGVTTMDLVVVEAPEIFPPDPLIYCDDDNDGFGEFTLSDADDQVTGGNPGGNLVVSYHLTLADAQNGDLPITDVPYLNVVPFLQTVYARVVDLSTGCYNTTTLDLVVVDSPPIIDPLPIALCDDDGDGIEIFDFTIRESDILNGLDPADYTITYYEDMNLTIPIGNPTTYPNITNPQTIYVVVEDNGNGCQSVTTLLLEVHLPPVLIAPTPLELCDVNNPGDEMEAFDLESRTFEITGGNSNLVITYHETQGDADSGINALLSPYINVLDNPQTIFVRAEDSNTGCVVSDQVTLDLIVNPLPSPVTPTPLEVCDDDNDGFAEFDLMSKDLEIIGGEPGVSVTYHETLIDAENGVFALASPYINIQTPTQTVYVRAEYPLTMGGSGCFRVVELELVVLPSPQVPLILDPLTLCDDDGDGIGMFDLTERSPDIYGGQDPADYTLSYYETFLDADAGVNAIASPQIYTNTSNPQTIFVRLEDNVSLCYSLGEFELQVLLGPVLIQPTAYTLCDDLGEVNDGFTVFDLTIKNDEITGGDPNLDVRYYETQADADNDVNEIDPDTAYTNTDNPQTLYIRVTDGNTDCYDTTITLTLRVESNPTPGQPDDLRLCDDNDPGDEIEVFDLTQVEPQVIGTSDWDVSYHESYQDAFDNVNAIVAPDAYSNISNPQTIYVRVTNNNTPEGCFEIVEFDLIVDPLPDDTASIEDEIVCEIGSDGVYIFDLTAKIDEILNGQDPAIFEVSFYETDVDAAAGINAIVNPGDYQSDGSVSPPGQAIWVGILNSDTGCYIGGVQHFYLQVLEGAQAFEPSFPYAICDNLGSNDGIGEFDFILFDSNIHGIDIREEILGGQDPAIYLVSFHETEEDAQANVNPLPDLYVNLINPQIIFIRVTNGDTDCYAVTELILKVEELPIVNLEDQYRLCVDANGDPLPSEEGEPSPPVIDTGLDPSRYTFVWELDGEVVVGEIFAFITATQGGEYTVTVTEIDTGCQATATTTVVVSSPPLTYSADVVSGPFGIDEVIHTGPDGVTTTYVDTHVIHVEADGLGEYVFQLDDGPFQEDDIFVDVLPGVHIITIKDIYGCGSVTIEVVVIDYPRYVTPNQDGYHDTWNIIGMGYQDPTAKIYIFDRFGKLIKQLSPMGEGWDGTYNGNPMPSSDYWFRVEYTTDNQTSKLFKGHFSLKR
jgi:gliding motility-associated-like protein